MLATSPSQKARQVLMRTWRKAFVLLVGMLNGDDVMGNTVCVLDAKRLALSF